MKKLMMIALIGCGVAFAEEVPTPAPTEETLETAPKGDTLAQYIARGKKVCEKKGIQFNEKKATARFNSWDANKDGILTAEEIQAARKKTK
jgi:hypothetical protein